MNMLDSIIYGVVQGITEFLPVSSSGHLALLPGVLGIKDPGVTFDLAMHLGTALALLIYFRKELSGLLKALLFSKEKSQGMAFTLNFCISTMATMIPALIFKDFAEKYARGPIFIALNLFVFGLLMYLADKFGSVSDKEKFGEGELESKLNWKKAILLGLAQFVAIFPGVSRSGATLACARFLKLGRLESSRYSFLMSLPVIFGGFLIKLKETNSALEWDLLIIGIVTSFISGILAISFFMKILGRFGLLPYTLYRTLMALVILLLLQ